MALCESQLDSALPLLKREEQSPNSDNQSPEKKPRMDSNGDIYGQAVPGGLPLSVDYRSPVSHFVPPAVEMYAARQKSGALTTPDTSDGSSNTPMKRKRGRPRVDKTSPEYLANLAARQQAKEMAAMMNNSAASTPDSGEKRKRGRPRVDKTSPEYLARKRARELEALERKAKKENRRRNAGAKPNGTPLTSRVAKKLPAHKKIPQKLRKLPTKKKVAVRKVGDKKAVMRRNTKFVKRKDSAASSSAGDTTPRVKRKYTKRAPTKSDGTPTAERVKGKRGRPRKTEVMANRQNMHGNMQPKIRVRSNLMPDSEPISLDSDDEPDLGSPSQASDSLSLDENLRALRHIHEKYANIDKDDLYEAHLITANFKKPNHGTPVKDDDVLSIRSSEGGASVQELETRVEKLEDSSNSDSDSSSSSSSSSDSSSDSSSGSSSSSDSESEDELPVAEPPRFDNNDSRSFGAWSAENDESGSESDPERQTAPPPPVGDDDVSCSDNESADKSFQCHICRKWFSTRVTLKIHRRSHQNRGGGGGRSRARSSDKYECTYCVETFSNNEQLNIHQNEAHRGAMTVKCEVCRRCFEHDSELSEHARQHTDDERAGRCTDCGARFPRFDQLTRHRITAHNVTPSHASHACRQCGKRFSHVHSLTRHMHNHTKQLFRCVVCKASFARADQLAQHLNSHLANYKRLKP